MSEGPSSFGDAADRPARWSWARLPAAHPAVPAVGPLADLLLELALPADDPRRAIGAGDPGPGRCPGPTGRDDRAGTRCRVRAWAVAIGGRPGSGRQRRGRRRDAPVALDDPDDRAVDGALVWSTVAIDRHRLRDQLRELRIAPWADAAGDGAAIRMAAARGALSSGSRLPLRSGRGAPPDLVVTSSGVWSCVPCARPSPWRSSTSSVVPARASRVRPRVACSACSVRSRIRPNAGRSWLTSPTTCSSRSGRRHAGRPASGPIGRRLMVHGAGGPTETRPRPRRPGAGRPRPGRDGDRGVPLP